MLEIIVVVLLVMWGLGMVTSSTMGGMLHVLLLIAAVVLVLHFIRGRG